jgi:hypothetical protein
MDAVFLAAFEIKINVHLQIFVLLRGGLGLDETMMRRRHNFLADFTMDVPAAGMSFE